MALRAQNRSLPPAHPFPHQARPGVSRRRRGLGMAWTPSQPAAQILGQRREVLEGPAQWRGARIPVALAVHQRPLVTSPAGWCRRLAQTLRSLGSDRQWSCSRRWCSCCCFLQNKTKLCYQFCKVVQIKSHCNFMQFKPVACRCWSERIQMSRLVVAPPGGEPTSE